MAQGIVKDPSQQRTTEISKPTWHLCTLYYNYGASIQTLICSIHKKQMIFTPLSASELSTAALKSVQHQVLQQGKQIQQTKAQIR